MPMLEVDGKLICQTAVILRYLATEFGQYGDNNSEKADIDQNFETLVELMPSFLSISHNKELSEDEKVKYILINHRKNKSGAYSVRYFS